ncbi:MAG: NAD(+)/NADH kinase [Ignavibacteriota bacterium]|jgi:NAD+ kinase|nr:MAG: NAD(+)/NADH kinase [Chlorobiota bacterium]MBE7476154.1 NAD(+)/NADH kinase [Ignavibacteriales bacterium]MBL1124145.1 NAD(+)/NADH kinase [Ignavibacteriota bacterium]MCC7093607.1 NAD(+)/NADH kinase [Ignavibacteriaceae bacterium]MCE7857188.1 NAD(+)/NADH kinase [Ignavibacteria bacterium CHB3]MEB2297176.1 NAD(+)/NADH kinase [Ignavibacteria bacterium]
MVIGIIANTTKENILDVVTSFTSKLKNKKIDYLLTKSIVESKGKLKITSHGNYNSGDDDIFKESDVIISIGGDGTMLATAFKAHIYNKPVLGLNLGKLGFLVETDVTQMDSAIDLLKKREYSIEDRMVLSGVCSAHATDELIAVNDLVIEKGGWPKMIELAVWVDDEYVTTFSADGLIVATPTGSTGYSLSTGGPIVAPTAKAITLSPISPHSLTVRPIVLSGKQVIKVRAKSPHTKIQVSCDGQRVFSFQSPMEIVIKKSNRPLKLIKTSLTTYFETLRNKLLWGIDVRVNKLNSEEKE